MATKAHPRKSRIKILTEQIDECYEAADHKWFNRTKFSIKHEDKLRYQIRFIDLLREQYLKELWDEYEDSPDEVEFLREEKNPWGKLRYVFCDGNFHFVTNKKEVLQYGYQCNCQEE
jgi:hypothetical protein